MSTKKIIKNKTSYSKAIYNAFDSLLKKDDDVFVIGQGVWSPWYVGNTMNGLESKYGKDRIIDTPVSELATTGAAIGASLNGKKPIVVHPRMDFMLYAMDPIVNQAAKWNYMFAGKSNCNVTIRSIINRGNEQGAQHSQALHAWFMHIPGLRVVMPYTPSDAKNLLEASVNCPDPVIYIDDKWLYSDEDYIQNTKLKLDSLEPQLLKKGNNLTIVSAGYSTKIAVELENKLKKRKISCDVIDLRVLTNIKINKIIRSLKKTNRLLTIDHGWGPCGLSSEVLSLIFEKIDLKNLKSNPKRITLPFAPAPTSNSLEKKYYFDSNSVEKEVLKHFKF